MARPQNSETSRVSPNFFKKNNLFVRAWPLDFIHHDHHTSSTPEFCWSDGTLFSPKSFPSFIPEQKSWSLYRTTGERKLLVCLRCVTPRVHKLLRAYMCVKHVHFCRAAAELKPSNIYLRPLFIPVHGHQLPVKCGY